MKTDDSCITWENQGNSLDFTALQAMTRNHMLSVYEMFEKNGEGPALLRCRIDHSP